MSKFKTLVAVAAFSVAFAMPAYANTCKVTDPTSTPLNVRAKVAGKVIATVPNGKTVYITEYDYDKKGRPWVLIFDARTNKYIGWVYREFVSCF